MHSNLPAQIFELMKRNDATEQAGNSAMCVALTLSLLKSGLSKELALEMFADCWDYYEPKMGGLIERAKRKLS